MIATPFVIIIFIIAVIGVLMWLSRDAKNLDAGVSLDQGEPVAPYKIEQPPLSEAITEVAAAVQAVADTKVIEESAGEEVPVEDKSVAMKKVRQAKNDATGEKPKRKPRAKKV